MRLLRVIGSMEPSNGGPCEGIRNSVPELEKLGVYNEIISLDDPGASFLSTEILNIQALGPAQGGWGYSSKFIPWLIDNLDRFDAVIVHGLWLYPSFAVNRAIRRLRQQPLKNKIPMLFIMPHGMLDPYFQKAPSRKLKAIRNWVYWKLIEQYVISEADGVLFTCEEELRLARKPFRPYSPKKEINVGYGIAEPPSFTSDMHKAFLEKCPGLDQPYVLYLSRIHPKKGVDLLINAYITVLKTHKDLSIPKLVIAGPGLELPFGQEILRLVSEASLNDCIYFPGMLKGNAKWGAFYGCEAFILPSHQENFGIAVAEALACGKPVLISNQVNIWREIEAAGAGIVADDTLEGTQELLENWLKLPNEEKQATGTRARKLYHKHFAIEQAAGQLILSLKNCCHLE